MPHRISNGGCGCDILSPFQGQPWMLGPTLETIFCGRLLESTTVGTESVSAAHFSDSWSISLFLVADQSEQVLL